MIRAQVTLTPTESKKFIAEGVAERGPVKRALARGMIVIHPGSSALFVAERLAGRRIRGKDRVWCCGVIVPEGACVDARRRLSRKVHTEPGVKVTRRPPEEFPDSWVIKNGKLTSGAKLGELLDQMGPGDVYIKGVNALDPSGKAGVLYGNKLTAGGTIALAQARSRRRGFSMVLLRL